MTTTPTLWRADTQANTTDTIDDPFAGLLSGQYNASIVGLAGGGYVVAWEDDTNTFGAGLGPNDIVAQMFDASGNKVGTEFVASQVYFDYDQGQPELTALADGGFAVVYRTEDAAGVGDGQNVIVEFFSADGTNLGSDDFRQFPGGPSGLDDTSPAIAALSGSDYAIVYEQTDGVFVDIVGHVVSGGVVGEAFTVEGTGEASRNPEIAAFANGDFVIVYERDDTVNSLTEIRAQLRGADGGEIDDLLLATATLGETHAPAVTALEGGEIAVAWQDAGINAGGDGLRVGVFTADGSPLALVDSTSFATTATGDHASPSISALDDGGFVVVWVESETGAVRGQRFSFNGTLVGSEFVAAASADALSDPRVTTLADGRLLISYTSDEGGGDQDVHTTIWDPRTSPISGTDGDDVLTSRVDGASVFGLAGNDTLLGGDGNDILNGGAGDDTLIGGLGDDTYTVHSLGDSYTELSGNGSLDRVAAAVSWTLAAGDDIELLTTTGGAGTRALSLTGNALAQEIIGNYGDNILHDGGKGAGDHLRGLSGNDTYRVFNSDTTIVESAAQGNLDTVISGYDYVLGAGVHVEVLQTNAGMSTRNLALTGNELGQEITGNNGDNRLEGQGGDDTLRGLGGNDSFVFADALGPDNVDTILDFDPLDDRFLMSNDIFSGFGDRTGAILPGHLRVNTTGEAQDASDMIIYDSDDGFLYYDADGFGAGDRVHFATIDADLAITNSDFVLA